MIRHLVVGTLSVVVVLVAGCAGRAVERGQRVASPGVQLVRPPDVSDPRYPGGVHVLADAPLARWQQVAVFGTHEACETSRTHRIDEAIDQARLEVGERAKYQLSVRHAVNARCVAAR